MPFELRWSSTVQVDESVDEFGTGQLDAETVVAGDSKRGLLEVQVANLSSSADVVDVR